MWFAPAEHLKMVGGCHGDYLCEWHSALSNLPQTYSCMRMPASLQQPCACQYEWFGQGVPQSGLQVFQAWILVLGKQWLLVVAYIWLGTRDKQGWVLCIIVAGCATSVAMFCQLHISLVSAALIAAAARERQLLHAGLAVGSKL
jgi:hypothetical protein